MDRQDKEALYRYLTEDVAPFLERYLMVRSGFTIPYAELEDILQECLLRFIKLDKMMPEPEARAWMYTVANHLIADYWRSRMRRKTIPLEDEVKDKIPQPQPRLDGLTWEVVCEAIERLTDREQHVILACYDGKTQTEIAVELRYPVTTVAHLMRTAKKKLKADPKLSDIVKERRS